MLAREDVSYPSLTVFAITQFPANRRSSQRYPLALPVELETGEGVTRNLNLSGVYFETRQALNPGRPLDFSICVGNGEAGLTHLCCHGSVLRVDELMDGSKGIAVTIRSFWFEQFDDKPGCPRCNERLARKASRDGDDS